MKCYYIKSINRGISKNGNVFSKFLLINGYGKEVIAYLFADDDFSSIQGYVFLGAIDEAQPYPRVNPDDLTSAYPVEQHPTKEFQKFVNTIPTVEAFVKEVEAALELCKLPSTGEPIDAQLKATIINDVQGVADYYQKAYGAKNKHHDYAGGLLEHTFEMLRMLNLFLQNPDRLPFEITPLYALLGVIYHDYGKLYEYTGNGDYTETICLTPHCYFSTQKFVDAYSAVLEYKDLQMVVHIILSHHGSTEHGAMCPPATTTAFFVHMLDLLSAQGNAMKRATHMKRCWDTTFVDEHFNPDQK